MERVLGASFSVGVVERAEDFRLCAAAEGVRDEGLSADVVLGEQI